MNSHSSNISDFSLEHAIMDTWMDIYEGTYVITGLVHAERQERHVIG